MIFILLKLLVLNIILFREIWLSGEHVVYEEDSYLTIRGEIEG